MKLTFFESEIQMPVMRLPLRSTLIHTESARLLISPIDFTSEQWAEIDRFGGVTDLIAPSVLHHLYMKKAMERFPQAKTWGMVGLQKKRPDIKWDFVLTHDPWAFENVIELLPVHGVPGMAESVLYCRQLKTLLVTDLCFNLQHPKGLGAAIILRMMGTHGRFAVSRLVGRYMKDQKAFEDSIWPILQKDFDRIVMAHGEILEQNGRELLKRAMQERGYCRP